MADVVSYRAACLREAALADARGEVLLPHDLVEPPALAASAAAS